MSSPSTTSSVIVGSGWFCALLVLGIVGADSSSTRSARRAREAANHVEPRSERAAPRAEDRRPDFVVRRPVAPAPAEPPEFRAPSTHTVVPTAQPGPALPGSEPVLQRLTDPLRTSVPEIESRSVSPIRIPGDLSGTVAQPAHAAVAEPAEFVIRVQNSSAKTAYGVTVTASFGEAWEFPGSNERSTMLRLGQLEPDGVRETVLALMPMSAGHQHVEFEIASETHTRQLLTAEAEIRERLVEFGLVGPDRRGIGQRAEYLLSLVNVSGRDLPEARVAVAFDPTAMKVREASAGVVSNRDSLAWPLGPLLNGERVRIQFEFDCIGETLAAPLECRFSTDGIMESQCRTRLEVLPPSPVEVTIADADDPWCAGAPARFVITVRNRSPQVIDDLEFRVSTSPHFEQLAVVPESASSQSAAATDAFAVNLRVGRLAPQAEVRYVATARSVLAGDGLLRVLVQTKALPAPFEYAESAVIIPSE